MNTTVGKWIGRAQRVLPSFFDLWICAYIFSIAFCRSIYERNLIFNYGSIFLLCLSLGEKERRPYKSLPLSLLLIWGLVSIFIHSYEVSPTSITFRYLNVYLISEGYVYLLFGVLLLFTIIRHAKNVGVIALSLLISLIPWYGKAIYHGRMTLMFSAIVALVVYAILNRKYLFSSLMIFGGSIVAALNWKWVILKWECRPGVWIELIGEIVRSPLIGSGFEKTIGIGHMIWVRTGLFGPAFRHHDYLSLGAYLGVTTTILVVWWVVYTAYKMRRNPISILFLTVAIAPCFQMIMFSSYKGMMFTIAAAIAIVKNYEDTKIRKIRVRHLLHKDTEAPDTSTARLEGMP